MFRVAVLFCAVYILALAKEEITDVTQCILHSGPLPINTYISGCDVQPCQLVQGQDAIVNIIFRAPHNIHRLRTVATAFLLFVPIPYDLGQNAETCNFLDNTYCPVVKDEVILYSLRMPIEDFMPVGTQLPIEFRILDDNDVAIMCLRAQVRITAPIGRLGAQNATMIVENDDESMNDVSPI